MSCRAKNLFLYALFTLSVSMCLLVPSWSVVGVGSHDDKHIILMGGLFLGGLYSFRYGGSSICLGANSSARE